ncbi:hypothetical protein [Butyricicoccus sp.]|uniref:hypothetical protein n=1 Tax=Butyricicoccus sp. TaxID=2049021 RepID=UPI003F18C43D
MLQCSCAAIAGCVLFTDCKSAAQKKLEEQQGSTNVPQIDFKVTYSTPLVFTAEGGMLSERSGVTNIGLEGMMAVGASFAVIGSYVMSAPRFPAGRLWRRNCNTGQYFPLFTDSNFRPGL